LTHARPYGPVLDKEIALSEIVAGKGTQFDPDLTEQFVLFKKHELRSKKSSDDGVDK